MGNARGTAGGGDTDPRTVCVHPPERRQGLRRASGICSRGFPYSPSAPAGTRARLRGHRPRSHPARVPSSVNNTETLRGLHSSSCLLSYRNQALPACKDLQNPIIPFTGSFTGDPHSQKNPKAPSCRCSCQHLINGGCFEARPGSVFLLLPDSSDPDTLSPRRE